MRAWWLFALAGVIACDEAIDIDNLDAQITSVGAVRAAGATEVDVDYTIRDYEGDDVNVIVEICDDTECGVAWQGDGADGTYRVTTTPFDSDVPHVFRWLVRCGRVGAPQVDATTPVFFRLHVEGTESTLDSQPFLLQGLGVSATIDCPEDGQ